MEEGQNNLSPQREYGPQPLAKLLEDLGVSHHQLVAASDEQLTYKMVAKGCRGRFISTRIKLKIVHSLAKLTGTTYPLSTLFNYR